MAGSTEELTIMSAKAATGQGNNIDVSDYKYAVVTIALAGTPTLTIKCVGATLETAPDFTAAQSAANMFDYLAMTDMQSGSAIAGDTGIAPAGANDFRVMRVELRGLKWLNLVITAYTAGNVTAKVRLYV